MTRVALESLYRLLWVYMIRIKCESNTATQRYVPVWLCRSCLAPHALAVTTLEKVKSLLDYGKTCREFVFFKNIGMKIIFLGGFGVSDQAHETAKTPLLPLPVIPRFLNSSSAVLPERMWLGLGVGGQGGTGAGFIGSTLVSSQLASTILVPESLIPTG